MLKKTRKIASAVISKLRNPKQILEKGRFGGVELTAVKGTLRLTSDYDDAWMYALLGHYDKIFDIGSNVGFCSLMAKVQGKSKRILLVDPNPDALSVASRNLILNNLSIGCDFANYFVGDKDGDQIKFWTLGTDAAGSMFKGHAHTAAAMNEFIYVPSVTIDTLIDTVGWKPDLVKVDVEGAEYMALQGASKLASEHSVIFMVEMHATPETNMAENARRVLDWCNRHHYKAWYMSTAEHVTDPETLKHRGRCHLLLTPDNQAYPEYLKVIRQGDSVDQASVDHH